MADSDKSTTGDSAEKAYAAAAGAIGDKDAPRTAGREDSAEPVEFPAKPKRTRQLEASSAERVEETPIPARPSAAEPVKEQAPTVAPAPAAKPPAKPAVKRAAAKVVPPKRTPIKIAKPPVQKIKAASKTAQSRTIKPTAAEPSPSAGPKLPLIEHSKEILMDVTSSINEAVNGAQEKAKEAFTRTSAFAGEYGEFAKGNVEAFVESGKILAAGLQDLSGKFLADSKAAFETATAEVKELSAAKSPTDFFKLQTELLRRNLDGAIAYGSKTSEAMLKLTSDVIAPISGRVSLAVEKARKAA